MSFEEEEKGGRKTIQFCILRQAGQKKWRKEKPVTIHVGIMKDKDTIKTGRKSADQSSPFSNCCRYIKGDDKETPRDWNGKFRTIKTDYGSVQKDGSEVNTVPGREEPFLLHRYKEESGLSYARI